MNRIIKFRAWIPDLKEMIGNYHSLEYLQQIDHGMVSHRVFIMQFTGLHDKNGKEVYEGDVVKCSSGCPHEIVWGGGNGMPGWWLEGTIVGLMGDYAWMGEEEVIGNVYENPELLK